MKLCDPTNNVMFKVCHFLENNNKQPRALIHRRHSRLGCVILVHEASLNVTYEFMKTDGKCQVRILIKEKDDRSPK